jgi:hypothetical protein
VWLAAGVLLLRSSVGMVNDQIFFKGYFLFFMYFIQHFIICRPSDSTESEYAASEPKTFATLELALTTRLDLNFADSARSHLGSNMEEENLQIRPANRKQGPAALTNTKQDQFDQLHTANIVKSRGGASEYFKIYFI